MLIENPFQDKRIILGVCGSISVYKALDLCSKLTQAGASVDVIMTESAQKFITPLAFQSVSGRPVYTEMWQSDFGEGLPSHIAHVALGEGADLFVIAPITAHSIAKLANGLADDLLSLTALSARCPVLIAPAMDGAMYENAAVQSNLQRLTERGVILQEPATGRFASGLSGQGRLPETPYLMSKIRQILGQEGPLKGLRLLITAGGTREAIDPVRFISNRSSGKQAYAIAQAAIDYGADVSLISTVDLELPIGATLIPVESAASMYTAVMDQLAFCDVLIMAAAVADFSPNPADHKIKKETENDGLNIQLRPTVDILLQVKQYREKQKQPRFVIGFAAESQHLLDNAAKKLKRKALDLLVANDISASDAGFGVDDNRVTFLEPSGDIEALTHRSKYAVGVAIMDWISQQLEMP
ncbi:bifunctional phosphopantothenoylcysteine decarboxylase/phosphopantothenate--cysteine ligase CoaBC [Anaerolineales bacterium]